MSAPEALTTSIENALTDPLAELGLDLEAVEVSTAGSRRVVRVAVDKDGGVTMDDVAEATRLVGDVLDTELTTALGHQPYTLEVTSRGVDRPLTLPRHWRRNEGRLVRLRLADDESSVDGRIGASDDTGVEIVGRTTTRYPYADITSALVQIELNRKDA